MIICAIADNCADTMQDVAAQFVHIEAREFQHRKTNYSTPADFAVCRLEKGYSMNSELDIMDVNVSIQTAQTILESYHVP